MATTATIATIIKILESLPEHIQEHVLDHLREYVEEISDETIWNNSFAQSGDKLINAAKQARKDIQDGRSKPMQRKKNDFGNAA